MLFINASGWIKINEFRYECRKLDIEYPTSREIKKALLKVGNSAEIFKLTMVERDNIVTLELQKDENFALTENIPEMKEALGRAINLKDPYSLFVKNGKIERIEVFTKFFTIICFISCEIKGYCKKFCKSTSSIIKKSIRINKKRKRSLDQEKAR